MAQSNKDGNYKMKIPKNIKIAGRIFKVKFDENYNRHTGDYAEINYTTEIITIDNKLSRQKKEECFLHECVHIILSMIAHHENKEEFVNPFGELLYQCIQQL